MDIENELPSYIVNDARRVVSDLRDKKVDVRGIRLPTSELKELYTRFFMSNHRPTLFGLPVFFGVEGTIDVLTVGYAGLNRTFNNTGKETDLWIPPTARK